MKNNFSAAATPKGAMPCFVACILPDGRSPRGRIVRAPVKNRDIQALDLPKNVCAFYFYDSPMALNIGAEQTEENASRVYLLAEELLDRRDVKQRITGQRHIEPDKIKSIRWDPRIEDHDRFIITRHGGVQPVTDRHAVLDRHGKQLWPAHDVAPAVTKVDWAEIFNPVLAHDIIIARKIKFRPKGPK